MGQANSTGHYVDDFAGSDASKASSGGAPPPAASKPDPARIEPEGPGLLNETTLQPDDIADLLPKTFRDMSLKQQMSEYTAAMTYRACMDTCKLEAEPEEKGGNGPWSARQQDLMFFIQVMEQEALDDTACAKGSAARGISDDEMKRLVDASVKLGFTRCKHEATSMAAHGTL